MDQRRRQVLDGGRRRSERGRQELALERVERVAPPTSIFLAYSDACAVGAQEIRRRENLRFVVTAKLTTECCRGERGRTAGSQRRAGAGTYRATGRGGC